MQSHQSQSIRGKKLLIITDTWHIKGTHKFQCVHQIRPSVDETHCCFYTVCGTSARDYHNLWNTLVMFQRHSIYTTRHLFHINTGCDSAYPDTHNIQQVFVERHFRAGTIQYGQMSFGYSGAHPHTWRRRPLLFVAEITATWQQIYTGGGIAWIGFFKLFYHQKISSLDKVVLVIVQGCACNKV